MSPRILKKVVSYGVLRWNGGGVGALMSGHWLWVTADRVSEKL